MAKEVKWYIRLVDDSKKGIDSFQNRLRATGGRVKQTLRGWGESFKRITGLVKGLTIAIGAGGLAVAFAGVRAAARFERIELQFKTLLGSADAAKKRLKELSDFAAKTPFQLGDLAAASRQLEVFTEGDLGKVDEVFTAIGDSAAVANVEIGEVAFWVGRMYSALKAGQPIGEASMRLMEMGILSGSARVKLEALNKTGGSMAAKFAIVRAELEKNAGAMDDLSQSGEGLVSTFKDVREKALAAFGKAMLEEGKGSIESLIATIESLEADGSFAKWGEGAAAIVAGVSEKVFSLIGAITTAIEQLIKMENWRKTGSFALPRPDGVGEFDPRPGNVGGGPSGAVGGSPTSQSSWGDNVTLVNNVNNPGGDPSGFITSGGQTVSLSNSTSMQNGAQLVSNMTVNGANFDPATMGGSVSGPSEMVEEQKKTNKILTQAISSE